MAGSRGSDFIIMICLSSLCSTCLLHLLYLFPCVLASFSSRFSPCGDRDGCKSDLLPVQNSHWRKSIFSNNYNKSPKRTVGTPAWVTGQGEEMVFPAKLEFVYITECRGQGHYHPFTWFDLDFYRRWKREFPKGKLNRKIFTYRQDSLMPKVYILSKGIVYSSFTK